MSSTTSLRAQPRSGWRTAIIDGGLALVVFVAALALYGATLQGRLYGDGSALLRMVAHTPDGGPNWIHALYVPTARWFAALPLWETTGQGMAWLSATCGAVLVAATFVLARSLGASRTMAGLLAACLAATPSVWFFSTTIELNMLHAAVVAVAACVIAGGPWRRPAPAIAIAALATVPIFPSHQSGALLQGGLLLLAVASWRRRAEPAPSWTKGLLVCVLPFAVALLVGIYVGRRWTDAAPVDADGGIIAFLDSNRAPFAWRTMSQMWIEPIALMWPIGALVALQRTTRRELGLVCLATVLPVMAFFSFQGVPERGAYALGFLPIVAAAAAVAATRFASYRSLLIVALALATVGQGVLARRAVFSHDDGSWRAYHRERGDFVRALGDGEMLVISLDHKFEIIEFTHPEIREVDFLRPLLVELEKQTPFDAITARLEGMLAPLIQIPGLTVVYDLGYRQHIDRVPELAPALGALEDRLRAFAEVEPHFSGTHEYWVLRPKPTATESAPLGS